MLPLKGAAYVGGYTRHMWVTQPLNICHTHIPTHPFWPLVCSAYVCVHSNTHTHTHTQCRCL